MALVGKFRAEETAILGYHDDAGYRGGVLTDGRAVRAACDKMMRAFDVRPPDPELLSSKFSGGNQQKLILAREMMRNPDILLVGQPTRGVDIGAIEFIHKQLIAMRDAGCAVLLVSVELDEILSLSDRIIVMCQGRITGEVPAAEANERNVGLMMTGMAAEDAMTVAAGNGAPA